MKIKGFKATGNGPKYFAEGGQVKGGNSAALRSKPVTEFDRDYGGKTPLRPGFSKGGKINIKHPGALHKALGVPQGQKIPTKKLAAAENSDSAHMRKMANFAVNAKKFNHPVKKAEGGKVVNATKALAAVRNAMSRGTEADRAVAQVSKSTGANPKDLDITAIRKGLKPDPGMLARGGRARTGGYGSFNSKPFVRS